MTTMNDLSSVVSRKFEAMVGEKPTSLGDWLHSIGKASEALLYSILFMPELLVIGNSVLLSWTVPNEDAKKRFLDALSEGIKSREELEASFNFIEVGYLFDAPGRDTTDEEDKLLANLVCDAWDGWLKTSYPDRTFKVEVLSEEEIGSTVGVHFFEIR